MKRNNFARFLFLALILGWAGSEMWPLRDEPGKLIEQFGKATNKDATFDQAYEAAKAAYDPLDENSNEFGILQKAVEDAGLVLSNYTWSPKLRLRGQVPNNRHVLQTLQKAVAGQIQLGLDLKGGSSFLVEMQMSSTNAVEQQGALSQAVEVLRRRVDTIGVAEPEIRTMGDNKIMVQLPGLSEADQAEAKKLVTEAAFLEFALVHKDSARYIASGIVPDGYRKYSHMQKDRDGQERPEELLIQVDKNQPDKAWNQYGLKGEHIDNASPSRNPLTQEPMILFTFNPDGAKAMGQLSGNNIGEQMAIILDGELMSAPVLQERITSNGQITGDFTVDEAATIANALLNPLKAPLKIEEEMSVEPSLGRDSVESGFNAALYGVIAVAVFMLLYYWFSGLVANFALVLNLFILIGVMCYLNAALTLPGIAGIVLTIGMAIDANVLIFERIREELKAGKGTQGAVETGYAKAFGTIIDANLTTLIVSVILMTMGTGPVKGFGVTLTVGICASMFTALVVTRLVFDAFRNFGTGQGLRLMDQPKFNFMGLAKYAFIISWILVAIGIGTGISRGKEAMGVDFKGGDQITFEFTESQKKEVGQLRAALDQAGIEDAMIQYQAGGGSRERLQVTVGFGNGETAESALAKAFAGDEGFKKLSQLRTGPSISNEILQGATKSLLIAMFAILVYVTFRYEFSFALGAILAICHDVLMTLGIFFLWGGELSAPVMAAVLTIIGFSINDTIVIFDRIREDLKLGLPGTFTEIMNGAISKTLSRTIITSGTTLLAAGSLFLFGGGAINAFAFALLAGVLTGTFSSIFIAGSLVLWRNKGEKPKLADETVITQHSISTSEA
ncbi:MAG: protein translocase subunit SecD [Verrucomicrobiota bacterium]|nr:protein translocase subunit SecD [Verrucomicrobiota bacterium]